MSSSLSNFVDNFARGIYKIKRTNCNTCCLKYTKAKADVIGYKCLCCNKVYQKKFDEKLMKRFANTYKFGNHDINKFVLLLQKGVYLYEYIDDWVNFSETSLPEKKIFIAT